MPESAEWIYLDVCALCRPFDDQSQMRIRLETEAVQLILSYVKSGDLDLVISPVHDIEIGAIDDLVEREQLSTMLEASASAPTGMCGRSACAQKHWQRKDLDLRMLLTWRLRKQQRQALWLVMIA
jgi:hypothetical protein